MLKKAVPVVAICSVLLVGCNMNKTVPNNNETPMQEVRDNVERVVPNPGVNTPSPTTKNGNGVYNNNDRINGGVNNNGVHGQNNNVPNGNTGVHGQNNNVPNANNGLVTPNNDLVTPNATETIPQPNTTTTTTEDIKIKEDIKK